MALFDHERELGVNQPGSEQGGEQIQLASWSLEPRAARELGGSKTCR